ncbi:MAG: DUF59 domain-containing protein, partial [Microthrixaceae bacterium]|nr:DUF59 domain-containing protein [Microthrixaceae bacterium]
MSSSEAALTESAVLDVLSTVVDPELRRSIVELGQVDEVAVAGDAVRLLILTTTPNCPLQAGFDAEIREKLAAIGAVDIQLEFHPMDDEEQRVLRLKLIGDPASTAGSQQAHGHAEGRSIPFSDPAVKTRVLLIASGKGGVGKSSVTTNLAVAMARRG